MAFAAFVIFLVSVGILLSLSAHVFWHATGRFMLAVGALASLAGYVLAIALRQGLYPPMAVALCLAFGATCGALVSLIARRVRADEFLLISLALAELIRRVLFHAIPVTEGAYGMRVGSTWTLAPVPTQLIIALTAAAATIALWMWYRTTLGLQWRIVGRAASAAVLIGLSPLRTGILAGAMMGFGAALAGAAYVIGMRYIHPDDLGLNMSLAALGIGLAARPRSLLIEVAVLGVVLFGLREILRIFDIGSTIRFALYDILIAALLIGVAIRLRGNTVAT